LLQLLDGDADGLSGKTEVEAEARAAAWAPSTGPTRSSREATLTVTAETRGLACLGYIGLKGLGRYVEFLGERGDELLVRRLLAIGCGWGLRRRDPDCRTAENEHGSASDRETSN
jgi:hypothetical protein